MKEVVPAKCEYRKRVTAESIGVPPPVIALMKRMHEAAVKSEIAEGEFTGLTIKPVCTHEKAPFKQMPWGKDPYYCEVCVRDGLCPLAQLEEDKGSGRRDRWEAVKV